jgi:hypothetical protein
MLVRLHFGRAEQVAERAGCAGEPGRRPSPAEVVPGEGAIDDLAVLSENRDADREHDERPARTPVA